MRLPRKFSMRHHSEFSRVRKTGRAKAGRFFIVSTLEDDSLTELRTGFVTSRRCGKAHQRVLLRRRMRRFVQLHAATFENRNRFLVTIARPGAASAEFADLEADWLQQARRLRLL